jgi:hypothetical protein
MLSLRSGSKTSLADTKKLRRPQKIQTPKHLGNSATADVYDLEPWRWHSYDRQSVYRTHRSGISDDSDAESWQGLPDSDSEEDLGFLDEAAKLLKSASNEEDTLNSAEIQRIHNSATESNEQDAAYNHDATTRPDTPCSSNSTDLTSENGQHHSEDQPQTTKGVVALAYPQLARTAPTFKHPLKSDHVSDHCLIMWAQLITRAARTLVG